MTKLSFKYIVTAVLTFAFSSCTLMLEEPPAPDEEIQEPSDTGDGVTSPRVIVDEFGKATYQFNEGVRVIDESYLPYLISASKEAPNDTVLNKTYLYFAKNIPADMIPQRGDLIGTHNVPMIDFALADQVDAVEVEGAYYKVTSHIVALDKVFKVLEGNFIFDIVADSDTTSFQNSRAGEYHDDGVVFKGAYLRNIRSRASDDELLTGAYPMATVGVSSEGKTTPPSIFKSLDMKGWGTPSPIDAYFKGIKTTVKGDCKYFIGQQVFTTMQVRFSLIGIDLRFSNTFRNAIAADGTNFRGSISTGVFCTEGSDVESDGFFPANSFSDEEYLTRLPDILAIPLYIGGFPFTVTVGLSCISDMTFELQSSQNFHFETSYTDDNFNFSASDKDAKLKKKDKAVRHTTFEHEGSTKFKYGTRTTFEAAIGFTLGLGKDRIKDIKKIMVAENLKGQIKETVKESLKNEISNLSIQLPSCKPLVIRLLFTYKDVNFSDNSQITPSSFTYNGHTYKCGGNSWRDRSLYIGVGARFFQISGLGAGAVNVVDHAVSDYGCEELQTAYSSLDRLRKLLSTGVANGKIWGKHTSKYATFEHSVKLYEDNEDNNTQTYRITLTPGIVDDSHITESFSANRCFSHLQLFILDQSGKVITLAKPTAALNVDLKDNFYRSFDPGKSYEFEVTLSKSNITGGFMVAPAYRETTNYSNPDDISGWGSVYMFDVPFQASANTSGHVTAKSRLCQKGAAPYYLPDEQPVAVIFDIDYTIAADIFNKDMIRDSRSRDIEIDVSFLDAAGKPLGIYDERLIPIEKRAGQIKLRAFFLNPEEKGIKQVRIIARALRWTEGFFGRDYKPITLIDRTFDIFVPKGEEYLLTKEDIEKYRSQGCYNMLFY